MRPAAAVMNASLPEPVRVGFVLHVMQVAGAEVLVAETIRRLAPRIHAVVFCLDAVGPLGEVLRGEGVTVTSFDRPSGIAWSLPRRMAKVIDAERLDVVHAHQYTPFFYGALAARLSSCRPRVIFTEHGRHYPDVVSTRRRLVNRLLLSPLADNVNAVCVFSARSLRTLDGFSAHQVDIIENGVEAARYDRRERREDLRARLGLAVDRRYIATVARFHPVKDHRTLLCAFAEVARTLADVDLLLVGDGPLRGDLEALAATLGVNDRVKFLGVRSDVPDLLQAVDVFALTSVSEAASITLLEAMASRLPVVVTAVGGNPEIVRDGIDGLLVPRGDAKAVAAGLLRVLNERPLAEQLAESAAARVRQTFSLDRTIERYYELYAAGQRSRCSRVSVL